MREFRVIWAAARQIDEASVLPEKSFNFYEVRQA
jgi:hypothetical protein